MNNSPIRTIKAKVELYNGSTLVNTFNYNDSLISFEIERVGENSKFFGFGISQKIQVKLRNVEDIPSGYGLKVYLTDGTEYKTPYPTFYINDTKRDENTNDLTIIGYDALNKANALTVNDLTLPEEYSITVFVTNVAMALGIDSIYAIQTSFSAFFQSGANFDGTETLRSALNAVAEFTGTIYYVDSTNTLVFKRLATGHENTVISIGKDAYFTFKSKPLKYLSHIYLITELGDNIHATNNTPEAAQYIKDNPFFDNWENKATQVEALLLALESINLVPYNLEWRGDYTLELGSYIGITAKDNTIINTHLINDKVIYDGGFKQVSSLEYEESSGDISSNPTTIGDAIKQTYAKVDKVNKQIDLVASETAANTTAIGALQVNTDSISASVERIQESTTESLESLSNSVKELSSKVEVSITAEDVKLEVNKQIIENGTNKVTTTVGTFDDRGLTVEKEGNEISTTISENGMTVNHNSQAVLTANNEGVKAADLHATTFLIIGKNSRFEDYGNRTACFWIGG